jgi:MFS family permease
MPRFSLPFLKAFQSYNYRLYFAGQSVSLVGTWMQRTAVYWLVYEKTQSSFMLGVAAFAAQFPSFMFSIIGGVVSDRYNRYQVMVVTQVASLIQAVMVTALVVGGLDSVWNILSLSVVLGIINAFDVPARQAMVYDMVDNKEHLPIAIALNSSMINTARLIGPAMAGIVLKEFGANVCFSINAISFVAVLTSLFFMRLPPYVPKPRTSNAWTDLREGFQYLRHTPSISTVMLMLACVSLLSLPYVTLLPVYADEIFQGGADTFGYLNSFVGLGAVSGAIFLASLKSGTNLKKVLFFNTLIFGLGLICFSHLTNFPVALILLAVTGFGMMSQTTLSNTLIQTVVTPAMRGRVLSYYAMAFFGMLPIGSVLIGAISHYIGAPNTLLVQGIATLLIAFIFFPFLRRDVLRRRHRMKMEQLKERSIETT